jgi:hypothetical protein
MTKPKKDPLAGVLSVLNVRPLLTISLGARVVPVDEDSGLSQTFNEMLEVFRHFLPILGVVFTPFCLVIKFDPP